MKPIAVGSEVDSWCTRCRLDLWHKVVAMLNGAPRRVECMTCGSQHNYRKPHGAPPARPGGRAAATPAPGRGGGRAPAAPRVSAGARAEGARVRDWEAKIAGQSLEAFARYGADRRFAQDDLILHAKFGEGFVAQVLEDSKISVMFRDGLKVLAHARG
ncbi:MAG: hypothetical protein IT376_17075 [Polyangiaceae bacterium]|nr:hypothetical protein [Polyangiaceae bacterium]